MVVAQELSKSQINKAGKRLAKLRQRMIDEGIKAHHLDAEELERTVVDLATVDAFRAQHAYPLGMTNSNLRYYVRNHGRKNVTQRLKKLPTVLDKLCRQPTMQLANMEDIAGLRAVLPDQAAVDEIARKLRKNWKIQRYRDYVRDPKESGYRAIHIIAIKKGVFVEVQLRTELQDVWANQVEHDSRMLKIDFKSGRGAAEVHNYYVLMSQLLAMREQGEGEPPAEFMQELLASYSLAKPYLASSRNDRSS